jgi:uncharacterized protein (DUF2147 family)
MMIRKLFFTISIILSPLIFAFAQKNDAVLGIWLNEEKDGKIEVYKCGNKICGKLVWLKDEKPGQFLTDTKNPDVKLQNRKLNGLTFMQDFEFDKANVWNEGKIYDPKSGKTYDCKMTLVNNNNLEVRGFIGVSLFGRTTTWSRVK